MARDYAAVDARLLPHPGLQRAAREAILGKTRGLRAVLPFLGPAFIACIAYLAPGNFATNLQGGAQFGYALLWVVLMANLMAMLVQTLAAKLGIATGLNLAEMSRAQFAPWVSYTLWITQEITAMATDLAEVLGAAIGIALLTGLPLFASALITGIGVFVILAMGMAGLVNMAMLYMAARVFHFSGHTDVGDLTTAYKTLTPLLGGFSALVFAISLIASGISSSHVGTMAGQLVMQGFVNFRIPLWLRRLATLIPALVAIYLGLDPTRTLVISQVVLSFTLPVPLITLIMFTRNRAIMGRLVNHPATTALAMVCTVIIVFLNVILLYQALGGQLPKIG